MDKWERQLPGYLPHRNVFLGCAETGNHKFIIGLVCIVYFSSVALGKPSAGGASVDGRIEPLLGMCVWCKDEGLRIRLESD